MGHISPEPDLVLVPEAMSGLPRAQDLSSGNLPSLERRTSQTLLNRPLEKGRQEPVVPGQGRAWNGPPREGPLGWMWERAGSRAWGKGQPKPKARTFTFRFGLGGTPPSFPPAPERPAFGMGPARRMSMVTWLPGWPDFAEPHLPIWTVGLLEEFRTT